MSKHTKKGKGNYLLNKDKKVKRCLICNRVIRSHNKSNLCNKCYDKTRKLK